jgi:hypothetical protein
MPTTYDVRIWGIDVYRGKTSTAYTVMWRVGTRRWKKRFKAEALADSYRSELVSAAVEARRSMSVPGDPSRPPGRRRQSTGSTSPASTST